MHKSLAISTRVLKWRATIARIAPPIASQRPMVRHPLADRCHTLAPYSRRPVPNAAPDPCIGGRPLARRDRCRRSKRCDRSGLAKPDPTPAHAPWLPLGGPRWQTSCGVIPSRRDQRDLLVTSRADRCIQKTTAGDSAIRSLADRCRNCCSNSRLLLACKLNRWPRRCRDSSTVQQCFRRDSGTTCCPSTPR